MKRFAFFVMLLLSASTMVYGQRSSKKKAVAPQEEANDAAAVAPIREADDIVLVVSGTGETKEDATAAALRNAIEQAFGTFVSANTAILNDELVRDEIATITSGNIKSFKELACIQDEAGVYHVSVSALVSIGKLISYAQAHGSSAEFSGQTFMMNVKMRELNKQNEAEALSNLMSQLLTIQDILFDFKVEARTPKQKDDGWLVPVELTIRPNENNYISFLDILSSTLSSLSLSWSEAREYEANNMKVYSFCIDDLIKSLEMCGLTIDYKRDGYRSYFDNNYYVTGPTVKTSFTRFFYLRNDPSYLSFFLTKLYSEALASFTIKTLGGETRTAYLTNYGSHIYRPDSKRYYLLRNSHETKLAKGPGIKHSPAWEDGLKIIYNFEFDAASLSELRGFEVVRTPISEIRIERMIEILKQSGISYRMSDDGTLLISGKLVLRDYSSINIVIWMNDHIRFTNKVMDEEFDFNDPDNYIVADYIFDGYLFGQERERSDRYIKAEARNGELRVNLYLY